MGYEHITYFTNETTLFEDGATIAKMYLAKCHANVSLHTRPSSPHWCLPLVSKYKHKHKKRLLVLALFPKRPTPLFILIHHHPNPVDCQNSQLDLLILAPKPKQRIHPQQVEHEVYLGRENILNRNPNIVL